MNTTFEEAVAGYDKDHEKAMFRALVETILVTSKLSDTNIIAFRTGETAAALIAALACTLAMNPSATRTPAAINKVVEDIGKSLRKQISSAEADPELQGFVRAAFHHGTTDSEVRS